MFGRYWRKVLGSTPLALESGLSLPAVFAQAMEPEGRIHVLLQLFEEGLTPRATTKAVSPGRKMLLGIVSAESAYAVARAT